MGAPVSRLMPRKTPPGLSIKSAETNGKKLLRVVVSTTSFLPVVPLVSSCWKYRGQSRRMNRDWSVSLSFLVFSLRSSRLSASRVRLTFSSNNRVLPVINPW